MELAIIVNVFDWNRKRYPFELLGNRRKCDLQFHPRQHSTKAKVNSRAKGFVRSVQSILKMEFIAVGAENRFIMIR